MADGEDIQPLVCDNGTGMVKAGFARPLHHPRERKHSLSTSPSPNPAPAPLLSVSVLSISPIWVLECWFWFRWRLSCWVLSSAMADAVKHPPGGSLVSELVDLISVLRTRKTRVFAGGFVLTFVACTFFIAFNPTYGSSSSPWLNSIVSSTAPARSQFNSFFSMIFSNSSPSSKVWGFGSSPPPPSPSPPPRSYLSNATSGGSPSVALLAPSQMNRTVAAAESVAVQPPLPPLEEKNATESGGTPKKESIAVNPGDSSFSVSLGEKADTVAGLAAENRNWSIKSLVGCDIFHGKWVEDASYPMYKPGSCPHIDESFNCHRNGRPDSKYEKLRWQPFGCSIPRLNGKDMLERLRGRRLVFVGDSLNRNMWESLICILRNSVEDKSRVFEASGRREFKSEGSYSFIFKDYNCSVEFYRSPFLVQEWEMPESGGKKKETLRLDIIEKSSSKYKDADVIVFNTGHWWTHEKTSKGRDYYQEGNRVYGELKVIDAFHKALITWARWVDSNIDPRRTLVFFRGYSASHFSGGKWNSGGQCDHETKPIKNDSYITFYPPKMSVLESVIHDMKIPVGYLNITTMTDYRKDAHPSIYRKKRATAADGRELDKYQDCSHWCLPGVPDSWNELLYAQILLKFSQKLG